MPVMPNLNTRIVDLRYGGGMSLVRGNHPRLSGMWPQYSGLDTGLRKNIVISDVITHDAGVENRKRRGEGRQPGKQEPGADLRGVRQYAQPLSEPAERGVVLFAHDQRRGSVGGQRGLPSRRPVVGRFSERALLAGSLERLCPACTASFKDEDFDAALVGLEVDVLNGGLPHGSVSPAVGIPLSKVGVQIVGFGKRNTAAVELRSEDTDDHAKQPDERRGTWHYGLIEHNALDSGSTFLITTSSAAKRGIDFSMTRYADSAIRLNSDGSRTGISFNEYKGGEIYAEGEALVMRTGALGLSLLTPNGRELFWIGRFGSVRWNGISVPFLVAPLLVILGWLIVSHLRMVRELKELRLHLRTPT